MSQKVTVNINAKWFEENKQKFLQAANQNLDKEDKNTEYEIEVPAEVVDYNFHQGEENSLGYCNIGDDNNLRVWITEPLTSSMMMNVAESVVKMLNKAKTLFETLK